MIEGRITAKSQTTVPLAVRRALGIGPGDKVAWDIGNGRVVLTRVWDTAEGTEDPFALFTEWADELDSVFDDL